MARHEADREDIMREATALVERAELLVPGFAERIVVGFRREGAASVFFGQDPVVHFNAQNQLRRAYVRGELLKAEHGQLVRLRRQRTAEETQLLRSQLTPDEQDALLESFRAKLQQLQRAISVGQAQVTACQPDDAPILARIENWLPQVCDTIAIAHKPNVG